MKEGDEGFFAAWVDTALVGSVAPLAQELKTQIFKNLGFVCLRQGLIYLRLTSFVV